MDTCPTSRFYCGSATLNATGQHQNDEGFRLTYDSSYFSGYRLVNIAQLCEFIDRKAPMYRGGYACVVLSPRSHWGAGLDCLAMALAESPRAVQMGLGSIPTSACPFLFAPMRAVVI